MKKKKDIIGRIINILIGLGFVALYVQYFIFL